MAYYSTGKNIWFYLKIFLLILIIGVGYFGVNMKFFKEPIDPLVSKYYAAFLTNGQVYFGQLKDKNKYEFVLTNVYYLQLSDSASAQKDLAESKFSLIKLGDELHGPTNEMYINRNNVLFYERLKLDSKVVQSINQEMNVNGQ